VASSNTPSGPGTSIIARVRYRYEFAGRTYSSDQIRAKGTSGFSELAANQRIVARFPAGRKTECHVNPQNPEDAALEPRPAYFLPLIGVGPMFIWVIYEHVAIGEWLARRRAGGPGNRRPWTERRPRRRWLTQFLLGVITMAFAGTMSVFMLVRPWWRALHAGNWTPTPCRILQSRVKTETHHQGWSFKAEISFAYTVNGSEHVSQTPDLSEDLGTSYAETEALVTAFPAGTTNTSYVNPADADDAVLRRTCRLNGFLTLFAIAWLSLGCFFTGSGLIIRLQRPRSALPWEAGKGVALAARPVVNLEPAENAWLLFLLCVAGGILCGALAVWLGWGVIRSLGRGGVDLLPGCYALVSAFGVAQSVRYGRRFLRGARNPSPKLGVRPAVLVPGATFQVAWVWKGGPIRTFRLWLEGREEAYVSRTTATLHGQMKEEKLQKARFAGLLLAELPGERTGAREFSLPTDVIPSFEGVRARIIWLLRVEVLSEGTSTFHEHKILIRTPPE